MRLRRTTRETYRHDRAVVVQQITAPTVDQLRADQEFNKRRAAQIKARALREGNST